MRIPRSRWLRAAGAAAALAAVAGLAWLTFSLVDDGGRGLAERASPGQGRWTIEDARAFDEFTLYWLGDSYQGLPLTKIKRYSYDSPAGMPDFNDDDRVSFLYGTCTPGPDSGCPYPLQIIMMPYCLRPPEQMAPDVQDSPPLDLRGALAYRTGPDIVMWTGDVRISVFGSSATGISALAAAEALKAVAPGGPGPGETLPPPESNAC